MFVENSQGELETRSSDDKTVMNDPGCHWLDYPSASVCCNLTGSDVQKYASICQPSYQPGSDVCKNLCKNFNNCQGGGNNPSGNGISPNTKRDLIIAASVGGGIVILASLAVFILIMYKRYK